MDCKTCCLKQLIDVKIALGFVKDYCLGFDIGIIIFMYLRKKMNTERTFGQLKKGKSTGLSGQFGLQYVSSQEYCEDCGPDLHLHEYYSKRSCKLIIRKASNLPFIGYLTWSHKVIV